MHFFLSQLAREVLVFFLEQPSIFKIFNMTNLGWIENTLNQT